MKNAKLIFLTLVLLSIITACVPESAVQDAVVETQSAWTPVPSQTPYPTQTLYPTQTPQPTHTPFPTYTPFPTPTPLPSPTATPGKEVLFEEDFSNGASCFNTEAAADRGEIYVQDGEFLIDVVGSDSNFLPLWTFCDGQMLSDFSLEVEATQRGGTINNAFGVLFRGINDVAYSFMISGDGYYCLTEMDYNNPEYEFPILACWIPLGEIRRGVQTNHLGVTAKGDVIELYVNDELVGHVRSQDLFSGSIGFVAVAYDELGTVIAFDNIHVTEP